MQTLFPKLSVISVAILSLFMVTSMAFASPVQVVEIQAKPQGNNLWFFEVSLFHGDTGWDHYAKRFEVLSDDKSTVLGTRILHHPHVNEQPFTRELRGVEIPAHMQTVYVRAFDNNGEGSGDPVAFTLPR